MSLSAVPLAQFVAAVSVAERVDLTAYTLPAGAVRTALAAAARRGASVSVRLDGLPFDDPRGRLRSANAAAAAELLRAGARASVTAPHEPLAHLKAAVVDGVAWLDDRNWGNSRATLLRDDDPADVRLVASALRGVPGRNAHLGTTKAAALDLELAAIRAAGKGPLAVASESFGAGAVAHELLARARAGRPTRLLVAGREAGRSWGGAERTLLRHLAAAGVRVRVGVPRHGDADEKLAVGAGAGWVGSANATYAGGRFGEQPDWGLQSRSPALLAALRRSFEQGWRAARPL